MRSRNSWEDLIRDCIQVRVFKRIANLIDIAPVCFEPGDEIVKDLIAEEQKYVTDELSLRIIDMADPSAEEVEAANIRLRDRAKIAESPGEHDGKGKLATGG